MHTTPSPHPRSSRSHALGYFGFLSVWPGLQFPVARPLGLGLLYVYPRNPVCVRCFRSSCLTLVSHYTDTHFYILSVALAVLKYNKQQLGRVVGVLCCGPGSTGNWPLFCSFRSSSHQHSYISLLFSSRFHFKCFWQWLAHHSNITPHPPHDHSHAPHDRMHTGSWVFFATETTLWQILRVVLIWPVVFLKG
jgi:hypothetical protein